MEQALKSWRQTPTLGRGMGGLDVVKWALVVAAVLAAVKWIGYVHFLTAAELAMVQLGLTSTWPRARIEPKFLSPQPA